MSVSSKQNRAISEKEATLKAVRCDFLCLYHASAILRADIEVVLEAIKYNYRALMYASDDLIKNKEFFNAVLSIVKKDPMSMWYAWSLNRDKEFVAQVIKENIKSLYYADNSLRKNRDFVLEAIKNNPEAFLYICSEFQQDQSFLGRVVIDDVSAVLYVSKALEENMLMQAKRYMSMCTIPEGLANITQKPTKEEIKACNVADRGKMFVRICLHLEEVIADIDNPKERYDCFATFFTENEMQHVKKYDISKALEVIGKQRKAMNLIRSGGVLNIPHMSPLIEQFL